MREKKERGKEEVFIYIFYVVLSKFQSYFLFNRITNLLCIFIESNERNITKNANFVGFTLHAEAAGKVILTKCDSVTLLTLKNYCWNRVVNVPKFFKLARMKYELNYINIC